MSVAPNLCCDKTKNRGTYTRVTSMVRDSDLTWLKQPPHGRGQAQQEPNSAKLPRLQKAKKPSAGEDWSCWKPGQQKTNSAGSSRSPVSDSRRPLAKVRGPRSYCWRDMPNEILIPLQSLISCFLEPPVNRQAAGVRDSGEATPQHVPKALSAEPQ